MSLGGGDSSQVRQLAGEIEQLQQEQNEIDEAIETLDTIEAGSTVQVPLGGDAHVRAEIASVEDIVVSLGAGYSAERDRDGAVGSLETKRDVLDERIEEMQSESTELESQTKDLEEQAQQLQQQQIQQAMQQRQAGQSPASEPQDDE